MKTYKINPTILKNCPKKLLPDNTSKKEIDRLYQELILNNWKLFNSKDLAKLDSKSSGLRQTASRRCILNWLIEDCLKKSVLTDSQAAFWFHACLACRPAYQYLVFHLYQ